MLVRDLTGHSHQVSSDRKLSDLHSLGCDACPLDGVPGIRKVKGLIRIERRKAMLWAQEPGRTENKQGLELVGDAGQFLWKACDHVGLSRELFDIQNVLRCWPVDENGIKHEPTKKELHCCSIYNEEALERNQQRAVVHLILGKVAATQLLGKEARKDRPAFWYEPWNAYVVLADHPSFLLRSGGTKAGWDYYKFLDRLKTVRVILNHPGRFGYVKAQDYGAVSAKAEMDALEKTIRAEAAKGRRVSVDIEDGIVKGKPVVLLIGFGYGTYRKKSDYASWNGTARSVVVDHPEDPSPEHRAYRLQRLQAILEDPAIEKVLQHGSYDVRRIWKLLKIRVRGYTFDTEYATYLAHPYLRAFGLEAIAGYFFSEFADYKDLVAPYFENLALAPLKTLVRYNCADADITKRQEVKMMSVLTPLQVILLQVYIHAAFVITDMQTRGPILDRRLHARVSEIIPDQIAILKRRLCQVANKPGFNPNTPADIAWLLYKKLHLPRPIDRRGEPTSGTGKEILETLIISTGSHVPKMILDYRGLTKMESTYLQGYARSADAHNEELRTIWRMTGTITGRMSSGGGDDPDANGLVNLQNLHSNPLLENMLVSDRHWRLALGSGE